MSYERLLAAEERAARNAALQAAEIQRERTTRDAEIEYSETVRKLRERFAADTAEATRVRLERVQPAHVAYNMTIIAVEHGSYWR